MSEEEISSSSDIYLRDSFTFETGKKYLVSAQSGHGKSSLLNFLYGANTNYDGSIQYGKETTTAFDLRKEKLSYVFQDFKLFPALSVLDNIAIKNTLTNHKSSEEIESLLDKVGLLHKKEALVKTLSLGQRQRIAIVRALCQPFSFLLMDEPFSHLDKQNIRIISQIISEEIAKNNAGLIMTSLGDHYVFEYDTVLNL